MDRAVPMPRRCFSLLLVVLLGCELPKDARRSTDTTATTDSAATDSAATATAPARDSATAANRGPATPVARPEPPQLLVPGDHYPGRVNTVTGETWLGLFPSDSGWALRATDVSVVAIPNACTDSGGQKSGRRVGVDVAATPLFLVRNVPGLKPTPARTMLTERVQLYPGQQREFELAPRSVYWRIAAYGSVPPPASGRAVDGAIREYSLVVSRSPWTSTQSIFTFRAPDQGGGLQSPPAVLWAGDLNGDGQLDLFVDMTVGETPGPLVLYVSNPADASQLLRKVAEYQPGHC